MSKRSWLRAPPDLMEDAYHYPPQLLDLLVETIARLNRAKKGVLLFFRGAGVPAADLAEMERRITTNPDSVNKFEIARNILAKVNARGDSGLRCRREIVKRVVEFESFELCWPEDQLKAKGLVASVRETVKAADSFTRMKIERDAEREATRAHLQAQKLEIADRNRKIEELGGRLNALFAMDHAPQERGRHLESVLNGLFRTYGILLREDFRRKAPDTSLVLEQLDGVIELDGAVHLVEVKWLNEPVGTSEFFPHLSRLFLRANAHGIFVSSSGFTQAVVQECTAALTQKTLFLCTLEEIVLLLQRKADLIEFLKRKSHAAIIDKNPLLKITG